MKAPAEAPAGGAPAARTGFEPWAWPAFGLGGGVALLLLYLGLRPGGRAPVLAYTYGPPLLGSLSALLMAGGLAWSVWRRPALQRGRLKPLLCLGASVWVCSLPIPYPSSHEGHPSTYRPVLPFEGEWRVRWGGDEREENALVLNPSRRFGVAFEPPEGVEAPEVLAPLPALLRGLHRPEGADAWQVVLELEEEQYLVLGGLAPETSLEPGRPVAAGTPLGRLAAEALVVHLEDRPNPGTGEGIPFFFRDYVADGKALERGVPIRGQRVRNGVPGGVSDPGR